MRFENFSTSRYQLDIEFDDQVGRVRLRDTYSGVEFADGPYRYWALVEYDGRIVPLEGLFDPSLDEEFPERGGRIVTIQGALGRDAEPIIRVRHRFFIPEDEDFLEEQLVLRNAGTREVTLRDYRFGFRKLLEKPRAYGGPGIDIESYRLIAVPFRLQPDGKKHDYVLDDLYHGRYECSVSPVPMPHSEEVVDAGKGRSEGWAWTDGENGLLIAKYNRKMIEFSMMETERVGDATYLNFAGTAPCLYGEPNEACRMAPGGEIGFGHTLLKFYEGRWRQGSYLFREYMSSLGHGLPDDYNPPLHWNELYDIGWHHNNREKLAEHYTFETLAAEAAKARDLGCESLYLDPGWETCEGGTMWDTSRLGEARDFVTRIKDEYGLKVAFRTIGRAYCDDYPGMYRIDQDGRIGIFVQHGKLFWEPCFCSGAYREEKLARIVKIAEAGMDFIMFDEFDWRGPCFDPNHGHPVPTTPDMHSRAVMELVQMVHERCPHVTIEAHDTVWPWGVRYLPVHYLHDLKDSFDEGWAFEFMWRPLEDILSGQALSLFYYNLAYDLPLYLHINAGDDNENCLAFWWYASTVRHLGIGGLNGKPALYAAYKMAIAEYKSMRELYTLGRFRAIDEMTHIHVLAEQSRCVVNAFNLTDKPVSREAEVRLNDYGLFEEMRVEGAPHQMVKGKLVLQLDIPPYSPLVVKMLPKEDR